MGMVRISLPNGRTFEWEGSRGIGLCVIEATKSTAKAAGATFEGLIDECLRAALRGEEAERRMVTGILAFVLQSKTGSQEHPGRFVDLLDIATDFEFDIVGGEEGFNIHTRIRRKLHS
jgi:hypothetical protein